VDVAIDQGGCVETARPTTHSDPVYVKHGVVHYCVTNIPGAVGMTSTYALTNATLPYALKVAKRGVTAAVKKDPALQHALNIDKGRIVHPAVKVAFSKRS
jgi:alanine dehydrogenase